MDRPVEISGFGAQWLDRKPRWLNWIYIFEIETFVWTICIFSLITTIRYLRAGKAAKAEGREIAPEVERKFRKRVQRMEKAWFGVSLVFMAQVVAMALMDGYFCVVALGNDAAQNEWSASFTGELVLASLGMAALFLASFTLVPLAQMILTTYLLSRYIKKNDQSSTELLRKARSISTSISFIFSMICLYLSICWSPMSHTILRFVVLEAAWGSALAWLDAAYAFNYCSKQIAKNDFTAGNAGVRELLAIFGETVRAAHTKAEEAPLLPTHEESESVETDDLISKE